MSPNQSISLSKAHVLAKNGRCKTFDRNADGYGRSDGCGVVILKRLTEAIRDHDQILAVIKSSVVNQDGSNCDFMAPSQQAQCDLIKDALNSASISSEMIDYLETHGTGTPLGDVTEVKALYEVFGDNAKRKNPLLIGSVKSNIGHCEAAAGIAGLIKVVLSLQYNKIPRNLHLEEVNPLLPLKAIPAKVIAKQHQEWPFSKERKRVAGISSFGFTGTNAHLIVEDPPLAVNTTIDEQPIYLLTITGKKQRRSNTKSEKSEIYAK